MDTVELLTSRLRIRALPLNELRSLNSSEVAAYAPATIRDDVAAAFSVQLARLLADPTLYPWWTHWDIGLRDCTRIGGFAFSGPPENSNIFVSYWIAEIYQRKGYVTEALQALTQWTFQNENIQTIGASTLNKASMAVLRRAGFEQRGSYKEEALFIRTRY